WMIRWIELLPQCERFLTVPFGGVEGSQVAVRMRQRILHRQTGTWTLVVHADRERSLQDLDGVPGTPLPVVNEPEVGECGRERPAGRLPDALEQSDGPLEERCSGGKVAGQALLVAVVQEQAAYLLLVAKHRFLLEQLFEEWLGFAVSRLARERDGEPLPR